MLRGRLLVGICVFLLAATAIVAFLVGGRGVPDASSAARSPAVSGNSPTPAVSSSSSAAVSSARATGSPSPSPVFASPSANLPTESAQGLTLLSALSGPQRSQEVASRIAGLRLMNYYPAADSWTEMWTNWDPNTLDQDFARIRALDGNAVRITVFPDTFGWPGISSVMASRFADMLKIAASNDLAVQVTLFDWWGFFNEIPQSQTWLKEFLAPYASDPEIQLVELRNEVDPSDAAEVAWLRALLPTLRSVMPRTPSTVSVSGTEGPAGFTQLKEELSGSPLDVADIHFYGSELTAYSWMVAAKRAAGSLPLFIGEIGYPSTDESGDGAAAAAYAQAHWYSVVFAAARAAGVSTPAPWTLYDFKPGTIPATEDDPSAYNYGLYSATGQVRPSVSVVAAAFAGQSVDTSNLDFKLVGQNNMPMVWAAYFANQGKLAYDPNTTYLGSDSVSLSDTQLSNSGSPSFYMVPTNPVISGQQWTVSAWAKGVNVNGAAQVSLSWYNADGTYIGETSGEALAHGDTTWTKLTVSTRVPANATGVALYLKSSGVAGTVWFADVQIAVSS